MIAKSGPAFNRELILYEKKRIKMINKKFKARLINNEDEEIIDFWAGSFEILAKRICAFFNKALFDSSKVVITIKNKAQEPISFFGRVLTNMIKLNNPKRIIEIRCKKLKNAD